MARFASPMLGVWLVLAVTLIRYALLAWFSPYALVEDEAYYWEWSRHLDWSYSTKGPAIAWLIYLTTLISGATDFGVRMGAPFFGMVLALACARMAWLATRDGRAANLAAVIVLLVPAFQSVAQFMTIDGPFMACWAVAAVAAWRALFGRSMLAWVFLGGAIAVGFLFKYTMLLFVPGFIAAWWLSRARLDRALAWPAWAPIGGLVMVMGFVPVIVWNAQHDWITVRHLLGHLGFPGSDIPSDNPGEPWSPVFVPEYLAFVLLTGGPMVLLAALEALGAWRNRARDETRWHVARFLVCLSLPVLALYLLVAIVTRTEGNWPMAGLVTLVPLAAIGALRGLSHHKQLRVAWLALPRPRPRAGVLRKAPETPAQALWNATVVFGLLSGLIVARLDVLTHLPLIGTPAEKALERVTRGPSLAAEVAQVRADLYERTGRPAMIIADHYGRVSQVAFYLPDRPTVHSSSALMPSIPEQGRYRGRKSMYDEWPESDLRNVSRFLDLPAVLIGGSIEQWQVAFRIVEPLEDTEAKGRPNFVGIGYKGFPDPQAPGVSEGP